MLITGQYKLFCSIAVLIFVYAVCPLEMIAQETENLIAVTDQDGYFFVNDEPIQSTLIFDIKKFKKEKSDGKYQKANWYLYNNAGDKKEFEIKVKARGISRLAHCSFPPIKMKFGGVEFTDPYLKSIKNQKLVTHCSSSSNAEETVLKEYLVYKLYNALTPMSFRVQMLYMTYIDSQQKVKQRTKFSFVIEEIEIVAERNNSNYFKEEKLGLRYIDEDCIIRMSLFQYMIGNLDWSISGLHNVKLIKDKDFNKLLPYAVPFDFDNTGLVNPIYGAVPEGSGVTNMKQRKFYGICSTKEKYENLRMEFLKQKEEMYSTINDFELIEKNTKKDMTTYIEEFYNLLNSSTFYEDQILPYCKK